MSEEWPKEYDREYTNAVTDTVRRRIGYDRNRDEIERFVVQLKYEFELKGWVTVVRSDHDLQSEHGYDVAKESVHLDVYRDGEKQQSEEIFSPIQPN